jgi:hypothetical protein
MYGTVPFQMLAFNSSCIEEQSHHGIGLGGSQEQAKSRAENPFPPGGNVSLRYRGCLLGVSETPTLQGYETSPYVAPTQPARLYSGGLLNITIVLVDAYYNVMDMTSPVLQSVLKSVLSDFQPSDPRDSKDVVAAFATDIEVLEPSYVSLKQDGELFVIGNRSVPLKQTADFTELALQPITPPLKNINYTFRLSAYDAGSYGHDGSGVYRWVRGDASGFIHYKGIHANDAK